MAKKTAAEIAAAVKVAEAEARKAHAEALKAEQEARSVTAQAESDEMSLRRVKEEDARMRTRDDYHLIYRFSGPVNASSVGNAMDKLTEWHRLHPGEDIEIIFNSGGGSIIDGFELFDFLVDLGNNGHKVTTGCTGMAASMAGILVQAGTHRWMSRESWYMIHQAAFGAMGKTFEIEDTVEWIKRIQARILAIFAGRSNLSVGQLKRKWERKDWWIDSTEALKLGLVDEIRASGLAGSNSEDE